MKFCDELLACGFCSVGDAKVYHLRGGCPTLLGIFMRPFAKAVADQLDAEIMEEMEARDALH